MALSLMHAFQDFPEDVVGLTLSYTNTATPPVIAAFYEGLQKSVGDKIQFPQASFDAFATRSIQNKKILHNVKQLDLSGLRLTDVDFSSLMPLILSLENLKKLDLRGNNISTLPLSIGEIKKLKTVVLQKINRTDPSFAPPSKAFRFLCSLIKIMLLLVIPSLLLCCLLVTNPIIVFVALSTAPLIALTYYLANKKMKSWNFDTDQVHFSKIPVNYHWAAPGLVNHLSANNSPLSFVWKK
jgi:hypothetical protein